MRRFIPTLIVILLVVGFGCFSYPRQSEPPVPNFDDGRDYLFLDNLEGAVVSIDLDNHRANLQFPDGGLEVIILPSDFVLDESLLGQLLNVSGERNPATREITALSAEVLERPNLVVTSPTPEATVTSPLLVFGFGRTFEQTFAWRLRDSTGEIVARGHAMTHAPDMGHYGPFRLEIFLPALNVANFTLEVYEASPKDGSDQDLVSVPLKLLSTATTTLQVYFGQSKQGSLNDCTRVFPVERTVAKTSAVGRAALLELLQGPTAAEIKQGYFTSLPEFVGLNSLALQDGLAVADFDAGLSGVHGSCRVQAVAAQIEETLRQFPTVNEVDITINGETDDVLQP